MAEKSLHELLIEELLDNRVSLSPREHAARNEIIALRERLAQYEGGVEVTTTQDADKLFAPSKKK